MNGLKNLGTLQAKNKRLLAELRDAAARGTTVMEAFDPVSWQDLSGFSICWLKSHIFERFFEEDEQELFEVALIQTDPGDTIVHIHEEGSALLTPVGKKFGYPDPAVFLLKGEYDPNVDLQELRAYRMEDDVTTFIPPYAMHGFRTAADTQGMIIAVTYPRIMYLGSDDFDVHELRPEQWIIAH